MVVTRDQLAWANGIVRLNVRPLQINLPEELIVTFPDSYPYFRFEIQAPSLNLPRHQNPLIKNLCTLGRNTANWMQLSHEECSVLSFILNRVPKVLKAADPTTPEDQRPEEELQGEPATAYFQYGPSAILVDSTWTIDPRHYSGFLDIGVRRIGPAFLQAVVRTVKAENGFVLARCSDSLERLRYQGNINGRWIRTSLIADPDPAKVFQELCGREPYLQSSSPVLKHSPGACQVHAMLIREEISQNETGDGWFFCCQFDSTKLVLAVSRPRHFKSRKRKDR